MTRIAPLVPLLLALGLTQGCGGEPGEPQPPDVYTIHGEISRLPSASESPRQLWVHHENVPTFKDSKGEIVGMEAMTMPFPLADEVTLEGLAVGDAIEFVLEVRWDGKPPVVVSKVEKVAVRAEAAQPPE